VQLPSFLTSTLEEGEWLTSHLGCFTLGENPGSHGIGTGWVPEPVWIFLRKISFPYLDSNPGPSRL